MPAQSNDMQMTLKNKITVFVCCVTLLVSLAVLAVYEARTSRSTLMCWDYKEYNAQDRPDKVAFSLDSGRIHYHHNSGTFRRGNDYYRQLPGEKCSIMKVD